MIFTYSRLTVDNPELQTQIQAKHIISCMHGHLCLRYSSSRVCLCLGWRLQKIRGLPCQKYNYNSYFKYNATLTVSIAHSARP